VSITRAEPRPGERMPEIPVAVALAGDSGASQAEDTHRLVDHLFRRSAGQVVSTLTRIFGPQHLQLAEDVVQEALIKALRSWTYHGVPDNPAAWIMQVARNAALDALRRERSLRDRRELLAGELERELSGAIQPEVLDHGVRDDQLRMIFMCCHPAIAHDAQVALTLKTIGGFTVGEIAGAFLVPERTIAQRLVRVKRSIRRHKLPFVLPEACELEGRLEAVLDVLYGLFSEGYEAHLGEELIRHELIAESIRLTALLAEHPIGDRPKVHALLALMLLEAARLPARTDAGGELLLLEEQDREQWDRAMIGAGMSELERSACGDELTLYHVQAGIAACHACAASYGETPWDRILADYDRLVLLNPSPVVELNRAVALAMVEGAEAGLAEVDRLGAVPVMRSYRLWHATRGELLHRSGNLAGAAAAYRRAAELTANGAERRFLERKVREVACGRDRGTRDAATPPPVGCSGHSGG